MEGIVVLLVFFAIWLFVAPIIAVVSAATARREAKEAGEKLKDLQERLRMMERELSASRTTQKTSIPTPREQPEDMRMAEQLQVIEERHPLPPSKPLEGMSAEPVSEPPPLPRKKLIDYGEVVSPELPPEVPAVPEVPKEPFSWERFMGVKMFSWLGGVAMFFGVIFFVKYSFENNLIPPAMRIALGYVAGVGLLVGGLIVHRLPKYQVLAQSACATGTLILYGVTFAAHAIYHFAAFGQIPTFILMALVTLTAFLIAVRLNAQVVAALGMLGGFLTPVLLSTGRDQPFGLFGYIALLDIGLIAVSRHSNWRHLAAGGALGTAWMILGWCDRFFVPGAYAVGAKTLIPMGIVVFFVYLFLAGDWRSKRLEGNDRFSAGSVLGLAGTGFLLGFGMLEYPTIGERPFLLYGYLLLVNLAVIAQAFFRPRLVQVQLGAAVLTFLHLALWSGKYLVPGNLMAALVLYLVFGALHAVVPVLLAPRLPEESAKLSRTAGPWAVPCALLLMMLPVFHLSPAPMVVWAGILLVDLLGIALAALCGALMPVLAALVLTMVAAAAWLLQVPVANGPLLPFLGVISGFSVLFAAAGGWLVRRLGVDVCAKSPEAAAAAWLPVSAGLLPYGLLVLALGQLPVANPSPVFGVALLMTVLLIGLSVIGKQGALVLVSLVATVAVEGVWHLRHFHADAAVTPLLWYLGFHGLFLAFPFVFRKASEGQALPWIASALSGVLHFPLVYQVVKHGYPNYMMGLLPAAFALPSLLALFAVIRSFSGMDEKNRSRMAWFGGVALFFITLIFPIQFSRQWLTVSWALEGAMLLWLFRRVPHPGCGLRVCYC